MLVIHGEKDFRIPTEHGIAAFTALQRRGIASALQVFPDEHHWVQKPHNSVKWHDTVQARLQRCRGGDPHKLLRSTSICHLPRAYFKGEDTQRGIDLVRGNV